MDKVTLEGANLPFKPAKPAKYGLVARSRCERRPGSLRAC